MVHCCLWVQFAALWSRPGLLTLLKRTWFSFAIFGRSSMPRAANLGHWSGQWVGFLHSEHLWLFCLVSISPSALRWLTWRWLVDRTGAVARMRDFISTDIHSMRTFSVADFPSRARSLNHTILSFIQLKVKTMVCLANMHCEVLSTYKLAASTE